MKKKCENCKYWVDEKYNNEGACYCHPPQLIDRGDGHKSWEPARVKTDKNDWCGDFKKKK